MLCYVGLFRFLKGKGVVSRCCVVLCGFLKGNGVVSRCAMLCGSL